MFSDSSHKRDHNGKTNHSNQLSRGARAYSTLPSRKPSDSAKSSLKDSRPISPPIKRSQNIYSSMSLSKSRSNHLIDKIKSTHSPQESHQQQLSRPKSLSSNLHRHPGTINNSNGPLSSPSHHTKGIDGKYKANSPDCLPNNYSIDENQLQQPSPPSLQESNRYWTVTSV